MAIVVAALLLAACAAPNHPNLPTAPSATEHLTEPTESKNSEDNAICALIDNDYLFQPTVPAHFTISRDDAVRIEAMLRRGTGSWLRQAGPLQRAIDSNNKTLITKIFYYLQDPVCEKDGFTPAT